MTPVKVRLPTDQQSWLDCSVWKALHLYLPILPDNVGLLGWFPECSPKNPRTPFRHHTFSSHFLFVSASWVLRHNVINLLHLNRAQGNCEWIESRGLRSLCSTRGFWGVTTARVRSRRLLFDYSLELGEGKVEDLKKFQARSAFRAGWSCQEEARKEKLLGGQQQAKNNRRTEAESVHSRRFGKKSFMCSEHLRGSKMKTTRNERGRKTGSCWLH